MRRAVDALPETCPILTGKERGKEHRSFQCSNCIAVHFAGVGRTWGVGLEAFTGHRVDTRSRSCIACIHIPRYWHYIGC
jgi:hypothetical protein